MYNQNSAGGQWANAPVTPYPAPVERSSALVEFQNTIEHAAKELGVLADEARSIADSTFGVEQSPTATSATLVNAVAPISPRVYSVRSAISDLQQQIARVRLQIERLSCI